MKDPDTKTVSNLSRLNDVSRFGRSIIEEWKNPPKFCDNVLRSDQLYEERAIDVPNYSPPQQNYLKKSNDSVKARRDKKNPGNTRPQSSGTVRSIPIKHYQASIAHNIGTLRRSVAPQLQFESSISEPEKVLQGSKYKVNPANNASLSLNETKRESQSTRPARVSKYTEIANPSRRSCHSCDYQRELQGRNRGINSRLKTLDRRIARSEHNVSTREDDRGFSDFDDYFHKSGSRTLNTALRKSNDATSRERSNNETVENGGAKPPKVDETRVGKWGAIDLERGHVGQKISAYEENARCSGRNWNFHDRYQVFTETPKHRAIGVPLVGMHNACGLPVVASWHDHELLEPLRVRSKVLGTLRPIFKGPRASTNLRHRTHPKRRAPQPNQCVSKRNRSADSRNSDKKAQCSSIRSLIPFEVGNGEIGKRRKRRPSFKTKKTGTLSSKNSIKRTYRSHAKRNKENSMAGSTRGKSFEAESNKRQTLYARDDGEDAVQVLKSLCLNPLARTKSETDMIW